MVTAYTLAGLITEPERIMKSLLIRTGVDLREFKPRDKKKIKKKLELEENLIYGLYIGSGRGGDIMKWNELEFETEDD